MKTFKLILGVILWIIVGFSSLYLYSFSEVKDNFVSTLTRTDSLFYKNALEEYKMNKMDYYWHYEKTDDSYSYTKKFDSVAFKNEKSYSVLDSLKKNNLIDMNSILDNLPKGKIYAIPNDRVNIGEETENPKIKRLYQIWLTRLYEKVWMDKMKNTRSDARSIYLNRIKNDAIGVRLDALDLPKIYLKQEIDIKEDQKTFSITTHYFGKDTLIVTKNYRITPKENQKLQPFDYEEILP